MAGGGPDGIRFGKDYQTLTVADNAEGTDADKVLTSDTRPAREKLLRLYK